MVFSFFRCAALVVCFPIWPYFNTDLQLQHRGGDSLQKEICFQQPPLREKVKMFCYNTNGSWDQRCGNQPEELQTVIQIAAFKYWYNRIISLFWYLYTLSHSIAQEQWKKATWHFERKSLYGMCEWNKGQNLFGVQLQKEPIWHFTCQEATLTNINWCWELVLQV